MSTTLRRSASTHPHTDITSRNVALEASFSDSGLYLSAAWGTGGLRFLRALAAFDEWFEETYEEFKWLYHAGVLSMLTAHAAMQACTALLRIRCPHEGHIRAVVGIRRRLAPEAEFEDVSWPFDVDDVDSTYDDWTESSSTLDSTYNSTCERATYENRVSNGTVTGRPALRGMIGMPVPIAGAQRR